MSEKSENTSEFPTPIHVHPAAGGLTMRDYFAAAALQGLISHNDEASSERAIHNTLTQRNISIFELFSESAYKYADAMWKARES